MSTWDARGGSSRSAYRIHTGLKARGLRSRMLVGYKTLRDPDVRPLRGPLSGVVDRLVGQGFDRLGFQYLAYPSSFLLPARRWFREADIVQLYNTHGGYFSHAVLPVIGRLRPIVWRLSDMWPMTGHCAYSYDCQRWTSGCGHCPILGEDPPVPRDTTALLWKVKAWLYARSRLTFIAPSRWMARQAGASPLLSRFPIHYIPNGVDTARFRPLPRREARAALGIATEGFVIVVSAHVARKGTALLPTLIARLREQEATDVRVLVVGSGAAAADVGPVPADRLGHVDEARMALVYAAGDLFLLPTLADNLPNGALESLACATPVVAFDTGGCSDVVRHMETGYLARHGDVEDLTHGVSTLHADGELRERLGLQGRDFVEREHGVALEASRFAALYLELLTRRRPS